MQVCRWRVCKKHRSDAFGRVCAAEIVERIPRSELPKAAMLFGQIVCFSGGVFQRINKRCNDFDGAVGQHVGRWLGQRLGAADHFQGGPVQIGVAGAAHQFERQHIAFSIHHEAQTVQTFLAPRLCTGRVLFVLGQVCEQGALPAGLGSLLRRRWAGCRLSGFLRRCLGRLRVARFFLGRFFLRRFRLFLHRLGRLRLGLGFDRLGHGNLGLRRFSELRHRQFFHRGRWLRRRDHLRRCGRWRGRNRRQFDHHRLRRQLDRRARRPVQRQRNGQRMDAQHHGQAPAVTRQLMARR